MSDLTYLFGELADEAKVYEVTETALRRARRRRRMRLLAAPAVATALVSATVAALAARPGRLPSPPEPAASASAAGPVFPRECATQVLPVPQGFRGVYVTGMDPSGRVVLGWPDPSGEAGPSVIWTDGVPKLVTPPGKQTAFGDMNSSGVGIGNSLIGSGTSTRQAAWVYSDGQFTLLRGKDTSVNAINDRGEIAGAVGGMPAVWRSADAEPQLLPVETERWGIALDIDEDGTAIGETVGTRPAQMYVWPPQGEARRAVTGDFHFSIRGGWVAGATSGVGPFSGKAARWNLRTGQQELLAGEITGLQSRISAQGWVAGVTVGKQAQLVSADRVVALPVPADAPPGELSIRAISADGRTVAGSVNALAASGGRTMPLVWHCR